MIAAAVVCPIVSAFLLIQVTTGGVSGYDGESVTTNAAGALKLRKSGAGIICRNRERMSLVHRSCGAVASVSPRIPTRERGNKSKLNAVPRCGDDHEQPALLKSRDRRRPESAH
eukprot:18207-Heterococcus_DN1.PRE.3